ncbi:ABC transporter ATP-binding protein [Ginsengibacter hankyongi]|uniref:ABC transporter ATP-binding protein n=1 Tax=Ginsengibacter hankyongi TaxID=2607284 RepID=A0A5J5IE59_9BACT|nr:ABC transporter ATP-binding protein [Ginsengibacter hankyongi]KAA9035455.1 ABC transporter ATP-binding protein [Ginsengibacter hankyongi]
MIVVDSVVKKFGNIAAIDTVSFKVNEGENVVLLGTSGCGKTTMLRMINRLTETTSGNIYINEKNIKNVPPEELRRNIGYALQHNGLFPHYTIAENIAIVPELLNWPKEKITKRTSELLEQLHLPQNYLSLYPQELSGGQQQRVGLARALAADPPLLLMDEPFGALDAVTRANITNEFSKLEVLKNKTIVLVTHDIREAFQLGNKILLMDKGKVVQEGAAPDLLFNPVNNFVTSFFEDQRMQLELNAVLLKDIWNYLPSINQEEITDGIIDIDNNIWQALYLLLNKKNKSIVLHNALTAEMKTANYDSLFTAFSNYKQQRYE